MQSDDHHHNLGKGAAATAGAAVNSEISNNASFRGHQRRQSLGKALPVTSLLLNFPPLHRSAYYTRHERSPEYELPPLYFPISESPPKASSEAIGIPSEEEEKRSPNNLNNVDDEDASTEQDFEIIVSECSSDSGDNGDDDDDDDNDGEPKISLIGNSTFYTPCLTCTNNAPAELAARPSAINEMCQRLCTDECRLRLSLAGFQPPSKEILKSQAALTEFVKENLLRSKIVEGAPFPEHIFEEQPALPTTRPPPAIAIQRKKFLMDLLTPSDSDNDSTDDIEGQHSNQNSDLSKIIDAVVQQKATATTTTTTRTASECATPSSATTADDVNGRAEPIVDAHELLLLKDFRERFQIAEALAKTSAMTSTSKMKQRLAARKLEIELESRSDAAAAAAAAAASKSGNAGLRILIGNDFAIANNGKEDCVSGDVGGVVGDDVLTTSSNSSTGIADVNAQALWKPSSAKQSGNDFEPPRDLLLYLVRMGSFNSAPKINNIDSQDDSLQLPQGLNAGELLQHVKSLRGDQYPPLLSRYFLKPVSPMMCSSLATQLASNDITDGLRYLQLNSVSRVCSSPASNFANHIRLLQWNILSQTLGQNNDGFVCCPEEALTWESRKFLIVQEILQNDPDIICLQEVDHFKFLQNILGSQNYEGIFFPKPDSPCLYIEENNGPDGCAIFFKREKYELKKCETRILEVWRVQSNQVSIAVNLYVKALDREICICTTHLKARHGSLLAKLRNEQGRDLIRFVRNFAGDRPVILCGDFNAEPTEPVYATMLSCDNLKLSSAYADIKNAEAAAPMHNVDDDNCNGATGRREKGERERNGVTGDINELSDTQDEDECQHDGYVQRSIQNEPPYTTWKIREDGEECHTIDYVFYAKEHFKVINCLDFPVEHEIGKNRTPSFQYPSDHFSLVCDLEILELKPKEKILRGEEEKQKDNSELKAQ